MKSLKAILGIALSIGGLGTTAAVAGVSMAAETNNIQMAEALDPWYYRGSDTSKTSDWAHGNDSYVLYDNNTPSSITWTFKPNEEFKFVNKKDGWDGVSTYGTTIKGSAGALFSGGSTNNMKYEGTVNGKFTLTLNSGDLYFDFADDEIFYYVGNDATKAGTAWTNYTAKPILVNGDPVEMPLGSTEQFKLRPAHTGEAWKCALGFSGLQDSDTFYNTFTNGSDGNLKCNVEATYKIKVIASGHSLSVKITGIDNEIYVLDKYGDLLNTYHKAYAFNARGNNGWPGTNMGKVAGTTNVYSFAYWEKLTTVIFNQKDDGNNGGQTIDLTPVNGKCLILGPEVDSEWKWNSNTWVSLEVAKFIDKYMKFETVKESEEGTGKCVSQGWYTAAKNAYEASSFAAYRAELCELTYVVERLEAWAKANGKTFSVSAGVGSFSGSNSIMEIKSNSNNALLVVIVSIGFISLTALGAFFILRKKKFER